MTNLISISDARAKLPQLVKKVSDTMERFTISVNNKPKVVLMSIEELEDLEEATYIATTPGLRESIKRGISQVKNKEGTPLSKLD
jgi:prevent-host-death family protein